MPASATARRSLRMFLRLREVSAAEAVEAFQAGDYKTLHSALNLPRGGLSTLVEWLLRE